MRRRSVQWLGKRIYTGGIGGSCRVNHVHRHAVTTPLIAAMAEVAFGGYR
jgi:hypothetical protein